MPNPLNDLELSQAREQSWNPGIRRLLDWYAATSQGVPAAVAPANPAVAVAPAPSLPAPVISLRELRQLAGLTLDQISGLLRLATERVQDIESLDLELLDVDQLLTYTSALGMALTISVDLMPGATRELISTRGKATELQREQAIAALQVAGESARGLRQTDGVALDQLAAQVVEGGGAVETDHDTQPPAPGELPQSSAIDAEHDEGDPSVAFRGSSESGYPEADTQHSRG